MEAVIAVLTDDIENDKYGTGQSDGQSRDIDHIKRFVFADASDGNFDEIFPHGF